MTTDTVGGVWTYTVELTRELTRRGVEVLLATMGARLSADQRGAVAPLAHVHVFESTYRLEWMQDPWQDVDAAGAWLRELEDRFAPDVVHLNGYAHGALPWRAPVLVVAHSCVLSWWRAVKGEDAPGEWDVYRQRVKQGLARADMVVAPTRAMLDAVARYHEPTSAMRVVWNGRTPAMFRPGKKEPLIFAAGRFWDEAKNLAALEACSAALPWPVYIAGETWHPDGRDAVSRAGAVHFLGMLATPQVAGWLARASIYALPARYEPFGLSVLEAGLAGCALVLGDIPSLREVWGDAALYVPPDDPRALERALVQLVADKGQRARLARSARECAMSFAPERMADEYVAIYQELISSEQEHSI